VRTESNQKTANSCAASKSLPAAIFNCEKNPRLASHGWQDAPAGERFHPAKFLGVFPAQGSYVIIEPDSLISSGA
jgi:hypothetical protein